MRKKLRLIKVTIYFNDEFSRLAGTDFDGLQLALKNFISSNGKGQDCVSIVRVLPTLASETTVDVELITFNKEDIDLVNKTNASDGIRKILLSFLNIELGHIFIKQSNDPFTMFGDTGN